MAVAKRVVLVEAALDSGGGGGGAGAGGGGGDGGGSSGTAACSAIAIAEATTDVGAQVVEVAVTVSAVPAAIAKTPEPSPLSAKQLQLIQQSQLLGDHLQRMRRLQQQALSVATRLANGVDCFAHGTSRKNEVCCVWSGGCGAVFVVV
jgi:hypothetical protein